MPQMAPLNWLTLMLYFTIIFLMFNTINFYYQMYKMNKTIKNINKKKMNWKW